MAIDEDPLDWDELPDLMTVNQLRRFLQKGERQTREFARENNLACKVGGNIRVSKAALERWLRKQCDGFRPLDRPRQLDHDELYVELEGGK